jgi:hypothetical protein
MARYDDLGKLWDDYYQKEKAIDRDPNKQHHLNNVYKAQAKAYDRNIKLCIEARKQPCAVCGQTFDPAKMSLVLKPEFRTGTNQDKPISKRLRGWSEQRCIDEIAKRDPMCKGCLSAKFLGTPTLEDLFEQHPTTLTEKQREEIMRIAKFFESENDLDPEKLAKFLPKEE